MTTSGTGSLQPNAPMVNLGNLYTSGAALSYTDATHMVVGIGQVRDSTNNNDIIVGGNLYNSATDIAGESGTTNTVTVSVPVTINTAVIGAGGVDVGPAAPSLTISSTFSVYVIGDSRGFNSGSAVISLSAVKPQLPLGYDMWRFLGSVATDGSGDLLSFTSTAGNRTTYLGAAVSALSSGASTTFANVSLAAAGVPVNATAVYLTATLVSDAGGARTAGLKAPSSGSVAGQVTLASPASTTTVSTVLVPVSLVTGVPNISYLVSNSSAALSLSVTGYTYSV